MKNQVCRLQRLSAGELAAMPKDGPKIEGMYTEMYGLFDRESDLLGIVLQDNQDLDFSFVLLTRKGQPEGLYCAIDLGTCYGKPELAEATLRESMDQHRRAGTVWG
jgi:hypothetical protein